MILETRCCIAGGGPAGMMLGVLLARAGIPVVVLEKHGDFLRDFRGDTVHPSTLEVIYELGVLDEFLKRPHSELREIRGIIGDDRVFVMLDRRAYWQCAFVIPKGGYEELRRRGIEGFRAEIAGIVPFLSDRVAELATWDAVKLLTVKIDRLRQWHRPGLLCIGDAAHAMSPIGGDRINLAIHVSVHATNIRHQPLPNGA